MPHWPLQIARVFYPTASIQLYAGVSSAEEHGASVAIAPQKACTDATTALGTPDTL